MLFLVSGYLGVIIVKTVLLISFLFLLICFSAHHWFEFSYACKTGYNFNLIKQIVATCNLIPVFSEGRPSGFSELFLGKMHKPATVMRFIGLQFVMCTTSLKLN